jgi:hypothetical protein
MNLDAIVRLKRLARARKQAQGLVIGEALKFLELACAHKARGGEIIFLNPGEGTERERMVREMMREVKS